jgi:hypothetical protein
MESMQELIMQQALTLLLNSGSLVEDRVYRSRTEAINRAGTPAIVISPDLETAERESVDVDRCQFEMSVEILSREAPDGSTPWDKLADQVRVVIHRALMAADVFPMADRVQRFYTDWVEEEGDNTAGNCMVRYRFTYLCNSSDLATGPTYY